MALKKKNVFQEFIQDDYVPNAEQKIVKYVTGKGNNLHEVASPDGSNFLVTMPKKYRQTVWLKKGDCIVIDPITEGKKVLGEIICVIPSKNAVDLIRSGEWPKDTGAGDTFGHDQKESYLRFFSKDKHSRENSPMSLPPPTSDSESDCSNTESSNDSEEQ